MNETSCNMPEYRCKYGVKSVREGRKICHEYFGNFFCNINPQDEIDIKQGRRKFTGLHDGMTGGGRRENETDMNADPRISQIETTIEEIYEFGTGKGFSLEKVKRTREIDYTPLTQ